MSTVIRLAQSKGNPITRQHAGNTKKLAMGYKPMLLLMIGIPLISLSAMSLSIQNGQDKVFHQCMLDFCTFLRVLENFIILWTWTTFFIWSTLHMPQPPAKHEFLTQKVLQKHNQGAPPCILQDGKTGKAADEVCGTVKAASLKGNLWVQGNIVASVYDQKPFYIINNIVRKITWNKVTRQYGVINFARMLKWFICIPAHSWKWPVPPLAKFRGHFLTEDMSRTCPKNVPGYFCKTVCGHKVIWAHMYCSFSPRGHSLKLK